MSEVRLQIDGKEVNARGEMTILEAAQSVGIFIPTLCHHEKLSPYGACRLCTVEAESGGRTALVASCLYKVEQNLVVRTATEKLDGFRKMLLELMLAHAPDSPVLQDLAQRYGAKADRFEKESSFCVLCGLCVRYCAEVKKKTPIGFLDRGATREINFIPGVASQECWTCKECFPLCPTSYLQATYVLTQALGFPSAPRTEQEKRPLKVVHG